MKLIFCVVMTMTFLLILVAMSADKSIELSNRLTPPITSNEETLITGCMTKSEVSNALQRLASSDRTTEQQASQQLCAITLLSPQNAASSL